MKVKCIDNTLYKNGGLTKGKEYEVLDETHKCYRVTLDCGKDFYVLKNKFKKRDTINFNRIIKPYYYNETTITHLII